MGGARRARAASAMGWAGPTIMVYGTEEQKQEHLPKIISGEKQWCQLFSEPGAGSDLASLQTRAVKDGDDYVINGQKIWTSGAHRADMGILIARTDPDAPKHRGISYFLVDMHTPGITTRPLVNMLNSHEFNEVYFEDARIPASALLGEENRGWYLAATTLDFERSGIATSVAHQLHRAGHDAVREGGRQGKLARLEAAAAFGAGGAGHRGAGGGAHQLPHHPRCRSVARSRTRSRRSRSCSRASSTCGWR
ncbi:MAG: acyl-CoA dehydrogenase family protein [Dehalococcoidia bacterium]|nr:acyl-CoA dehydrogenase family protein [Dehalococcoidia bacterium]